MNNNDQALRFDNIWQKKTKSYFFFLAGLPAALIKVKMIEKDNLIKVGRVYCSQKPSTNFSF